MASALVTGSTRGIGLEIATQLAERGFSVFISGRHEDTIAEAVNSLKKKYPDVTGVRMDVSDPADIQNAFTVISGMINRLDVLVNNAGILLDESKSILKLSREDMTQTLNTNALGPLLVVQTFLPLLNKGSRIVNISSQAGAIGGGMSSYSPMYSISKTTLNAVTCQLALALRNRGIPVNAVCPGWVRTSMGGMTAPRSVARGAETPVWLATEAPIHETGKFWHDKSVIPW